MVMETGTRLGPYEILAKLGEGGMGEVYRARDTKLDREVALKLLPASFASDPDRLMRFEREAKTLAALNHPNIAQVFGVEDQGATRALVMELVEGEDLSALIARGPLAWPDARPIALQIAEALEAAHEAGIVHRDLKPANIKVKADGTVKVLDFGLAKALETAPATSGSGASAVTMTSPALTQMGVILGTAAYMSPEQAKGRPVDRRADVWAFGCVLYEMLTGRGTFGGATMTETIAAVIKDAPDFTALPPDTPSALCRVLRRCLEKDPAKRLDSMHVVGLDLAEVGDGEITEAAPVPRQPRWRLAVVAVVGAAVVGALTWVAKPVPQTTAPVTRFAVEPPTGPVSGIAISPDGTHIAWVAPERTDGPERIFIRRLDAFEARVLDTGGGRHAVLAFSPDGRELAFRHDASSASRAGENSSLEIRKIAVSGGQPTRVCKIGNDQVYSLAWSGATIYFGAGGGIQAVSASGGTPRTILTGDESGLVTRLSLINDGRDVLFNYTSDFKTWSLRTIPASGGNSRTVMDQVFRYAVSPTGHLIYTTADDSVLLARRFLTDRVEAVGDAVPLDDLGVNNAIALSAAGTLVSVAQGPPRMEGVWINRSSGRVDPIPELTTSFGSVSLSTSGRYVLFVPPPSGVASGDDVWVWDSQDRSRVRLTFGGDGVPMGWSGQGDTAFVTTGWLTRTPRLFQATPPWSSAPSPSAAAVKELIRGVSPDGRQVVVDSADGDALANIDGSGTPVLIETRSRIGAARFSPDGRWLVYTTRDSERQPQPELWVRPLPDVNAGRTRLGAVASFEPMFWSSSDAAVVFSTGERWVSRTVRAGPPGAGAAVGPEVPLDMPRGIQLRGATPDGQRWLGVRPINPGLPKIAVVLNFFEELRAKLPVK